MPSPHVTAFLSFLLLVVVILVLLDKMPASHIESEDVLYFGYGSNLWKDQMSLRCPSSHHIGIGRLFGYRWMINDRGYANVVPSSDKGMHVYGLVYSLTPSDERALDRNEGVPYAYTKQMLSADFWASKEDDGSVDVTKGAEKKQMLVYIDRKRIEDYKPKEEYIHRINMGIKDGLKEGIPQEYFDQMLRRFIPVEGSKESEELSRRQASQFEDEK